MEINILIVDDDSLSLENVSKIVKKAGFIPLTAKNGFEAFEYIEEKRPDAMLYDMAMLRNGGYDMAKLLRSRKEYCSIPVIFTLDSDDETTIEKAYQTGACDFVVKPIKEKELKAKILYHVQIAKKMAEMKAERDKFIDINAANKNLLAITAHDLKNPLQSIFNYLEVMSAHANDMSVHQLKKLIGSTKNAASHAFNIIKDVLDNHNLESGRLKIDLTKVSVNKTLERTVELNTLKAMNKSIKLNLANNQEELIVLADNSKLERVFDNIISNAIKYTPEQRQISIKCFSKAVQDSGGKVARIEIVDQGPGISGKPKEIMTKDTGANSIAQDSSHGIGLNIVQNLVKVMNGSVWVENQAGEGANFIVELPVIEKN